MFEGGDALKWVLPLCRRRRYCWIYFGVGDFIFLVLIFFFTGGDFLFDGGDFCFLELILLCSW